MEALDVDGADSFDIHKFLATLRRCRYSCRNHSEKQPITPTVGYVYLWTGPRHGKSCAIYNSPGLLSQIIEQASTADTSYFSAEKDLDIPGHCEIGNLLAVKVASSYTNSSSNKISSRGRAH